jgi:hypothetical protein
MDAAMSLPTTQHTRTYLLGLAARYPELRQSAEASGAAYLSGLLSTLSPYDHVTLATLTSEEVARARAELDAAFEDVYPAGI